MNAGFSSTSAFSFLHQPHQSLPVLSRNSALSVFRASASALSQLTNHAEDGPPRQALPSAAMTGNAIPMNAAAIVLKSQFFFMFRSFCFFR